MSTALDLPAPAAARLRRPSWRDPKLVAGLVLVLAAVALGARVVAAADQTLPVWAARVPLAVGAPVTAEVLTVVRVRLEDTGERYLSAATAPEPGLVAARPVGPGELVPASVLVPATDLALRPVVVPVTPPLAEGLRTGARVDVWVSSPDPARTGQMLGPVRIVEAADVGAVTAAGGSLAGGSRTGVELMLDPTGLPAVLGALAAGATLSLVPVPGSAPPESSS